MYKTVRLFHFYLTLQPWKIWPLRILQCGEKLCYINLLTITKTGIFLFIYPRDSVETYHLNKATAKTFFDKGYFKISSAVSRLRPLSTSDEDQTTVTVITPPATVACRWHKQYNHISSTEGEVIWLIRAEIQEEKKKKKRLARRQYITMLTTGTIKLLCHLLFLAWEQALFIPRTLNIQLCC